MTDEEVDHLYKLQGRILACEQLNRALLQLFAVSFSKDDPVTMLTQMEKTFMAGLQKMDRPVEEDSDLIWEAMGQSLRNTFAAARRALAQRADRAT